MPATATTTQDDLDTTTAICKEMADDFRFQADDVDGMLMRGATEFARQYSGTFSFMRDMHIAALRQWLTLGQAKGVLNCMLAQVRRERLAAQPKEVVNFSGLRALFARAGAKLQRPRITLQVNGTPVTVKLMTAGGHVGSVNLQTGSFGEGVWYGRVEVNGELTASRNMTPAVHELVLELANDPVSAAKRYAHLTGNCCFCQRKLDDERSTSAGYGPVCAGNYGLPWGE